MGKHSMILGSLTVLVLFTSFAVAQTAQPKHELDVPYVPTTEEAVKAMLKLADVNPRTSFTTWAVEMAVS
jgi:hypothetical protein